MLDSFLCSYLHRPVGGNEAGENNSPQNIVKKFKLRIARCQINVKYITFSHVMSVLEAWRH